MRILSGKILFSLILPLTLMGVDVAYAQQTNTNYVRTVSPRVGSTAEPAAEPPAASGTNPSSPKVTTVYFDGLGRERSKVATAMSGYGYGDNRVSYAGNVNCADEGTVGPAANVAGYTKVTRNYTYSYDSFDRLTAAEEVNDSRAEVSEYDRNGNKTLDIYKAVKAEWVANGSEESKVIQVIH